MATRPADIPAVGELVSRRRRASASGVAGAQGKSRADSARRIGKRIGVFAVWHEAHTTFCDHAPHILFVALIGFAAPAIMCILASVTLQLDFYGYASGPFATWLGVGTLRGGPVNPVSILVYLQAGFGAMGLVLARGLIARIALSDATDTPSLSTSQIAQGGSPDPPYSAGSDDPAGANLQLLSLTALCRATMSRLPGLLIGSLLYGAVVTVGVVGVNAMLQDTTFDLRFVGQGATNMPGHAQVLALRTLDALVPSPGSPFAEFVPLLRHTAFEPTALLTFYEQQLVAEHGAANVISETKFSGLRWIARASVVVLILAEALLRFTPIMTMRSREQGRLRAITPVLYSMRFGIRHFGAITMHVWLLRLAFVAAYSVFFALPVMLSQDVAPSVVTRVRESVMGHWSLPLALMCYWLVTALFTAFGTVYDARLVLALCQRSERSKRSDR